MVRLMVWKVLPLVLLLVSTVFQGTTQGLNPKYEFRGVWVATVNNIDWPSQPGLPVEVQKKEVINILNLHQDLGMNAIILQVRPCADAFYPSPYEPWSRYLTGIPGKAPQPFWDPLQFWIEECHKRNMELHAWLNPYRIAQHADEPLAWNHKIFTNPEWAIVYGDKIYFDPGVPGTRDYVTNVVCDIVRRYDVDGIHMDDYFYPYPTNEPFPDDRSFSQYNRAFPLEEKMGWRRENVDILIKMIHDSLKTIKPYVKFGISPFGVWRNQSNDPEGSATSAGVTNYDDLYADIRKWLQEGWIDYVVPQIYWEIGHKKADFETLCAWWNNNTFGRQLFIGMAPFKIDKAATVPAWKKPDQIPDQLDMLRKYPNISGCIFFSSKSFTHDLLGFQDSLRRRLFRYDALTPALNRNNHERPDAPSGLAVSGKKAHWDAPLVKFPNGLPYHYLVYLNNVDESFDINNPLQIVKYTTETKVEIPKRKEKKRKLFHLRVTTLDVHHLESEPTPPANIKF
jgi:uncharacterized lipoprotein YddW (UPF0748 family)